MINCSFHDDDNNKESAGNDDDNMNAVNDLASADVTGGWTPRLETKQISEMWAQHCLLVRDINSNILIKHQNLEVEQL